MKTCINCTKELTGAQRKFCCKKCDDVWKYNNSKKESSCEHCKQTFMYPAKKVSNKPKYCSTQCASEARVVAVAKAKEKVAEKCLSVRDLDTLSGSFISQDNPIVKGGISEALAHVYMLSQGWEVYSPATQSGRTDFMCEYNDKVYKVQVKTVNLTPTTNKYIIPLEKRGKNKKSLKYTPSELDFLLAYSPYHNAIIRIEGKDVWNKNSITFSSRADGNYCGTSRFIEDYIVFKLT
ncbi:hypothetical protein EalM132_00051 [Exiguobacterium phage vB_EalM-132]|nr:hypothetical protein EalM132_00051 [Exiguobacterium phage vB_EalM-132]